MSLVHETAEDIKEMKIQGAIVIALAAASALDDLVKNSKAKTKEEFIEELKKAAEELIATRPTAISLPNIVEDFMSRVESFDGPIEDIKKKAHEEGKNLIQKIRVE